VAVASGMVDLSTNAEKATFIQTCAEFIPYIEGDCPGMSPGADHFRDCIEGLRALKTQHPEHADMLGRATDFYTTVLRAAPGPRFSMYPRGSVMFDDLGSLGNLAGELSCWAEHLEATP
jgi:hypothetical protein